MKTLAILLTSTLILSGCATLNKEECLTANWYQIGYEDGAEGYPETRIKSHREACAEHGIKPNFNDFRKGHGEGILTFCKPRNGFNEGKRNRNYDGICPAHVEEAFLTAYKAGRQIYAANQAIRDVKSQQKTNKKEADSLKKAIKSKKAAMFAQETTTAKRYELDAEISQMQKNLGALEQQDKELIRKLSDAEAELKHLELKYIHY